MNVQIYFKNKNLKTITTNLVLFVGEKFSISDLSKYVTNNEFSYISDLLKRSNLKKIFCLLRLIQKKQYF
jgi:leucyl aminopeptidase